MTDSHFNLNQQQKTQLLILARQSIEQGKNFQLDSNQFDSQLQQQGCCFVTLEKHGQLRGCIGSLAPYQSLLEDVAEHAFAAAYQDHRFTPLKTEEIPELDIEISVLTPAEVMHFTNEQELLRQIQPSRDGLIIEEGEHRATFLPSVWSKLPETELFLEQLKLKAGLNADHWSDNFKVWRYQSISFH